MISHEKGLKNIYFYYSTGLQELLVNFDSNYVRLWLEYYLYNFSFDNARGNPENLTVKQEAILELTSGIR